jgi:hypothetical protein
LLFCNEDSQIEKLLRYEAADRLKGHFFIMGKKLFKVQQACSGKNHELKLWIKFY